MTKLFVTKNFQREYLSIVRLENNTKKRFILNWDERYPCMNEKTENTFYDAHYIYHTAWAARILKETKSEIHIDISSSLYFSSIVSAFVRMEYYDFRPANLVLNNLSCGHEDLKSLSFADNSVPSLSCMHVVEHIGLGRYGDALDYDGDIKAIRELKRVLKKGGDLLFVVPIGGTAKIIFNAHRIYTYKQIAEYFSDLELLEFTLIPDNAVESGMIRNATEDKAGEQKYGCGCFRYSKH